MIDAFAEHTRETRDPDALARRLCEHASVSGPVQHPGGDRSIYVEDPEGNVVEVWDCFSRGAGAREGIGALR